MAQKYTALYGPSDDNAFWPGHLLDKLRLCMPGETPATVRPAAAFTSVKKEKKIYPGYDNNLKSWPLSAGGYLQMAPIK